jgi:hypothetical protein
VNNCPLDSVSKSTDENDVEKVCKLKPAEVKKIIAANSIKT